MLGAKHMMLLMLQLCNAALVSFQGSISACIRQQHQRTDRLISLQGLHVRPDGRAAVPNESLKGIDPELTPIIRTIFTSNGCLVNVPQRRGNNGGMRRRCILTPSVSSGWCMKTALLSVNRDP